MFYPFKSVKHTVHRSGGRITARVSDFLRSAPQHILEIVAYLLISRLYKRRTEKRLRQIYQAYCQSVFPRIVTEPRGYSPSGRIFNLQERFDQVNASFFNSEVQVRHIGWSKRPAYTRLAFYDAERDLLVISSIFDQPSVPAKVIDYLMYHEMLHKLYPAKRVNGRRIVHSHDFKLDEKKFPGYDRVNKWIRNYIAKYKKRIRFF